MARKALIIGVSGTGKSSAVEALNPATTFILNVNNKALPFKGYKKNYVPFTKENVSGNYYVTDNPMYIIKTLEYINKNMPHITSIVLDDFTYMLTNEYMRRAQEKGYGLFKDIGQNTYFVLDGIDKLRDDLTVFVTGHPDVDTDAMGNKSLKMKTLGKMIDQYINIEGMFTVVLYTNVEKNGDTLEYSFITQNNGYNTGKSPKGMFDTLKIPNDLELVRTKMIDYEN